MRTFVIFATLFALASQSAVLHVNAVTVEGKVSTEKGQTWAFITSFCFDNSGLGTMEATFELPGLIPIDSPYELVIYDDEPSSFPAIWAKRNSESCEQLVAARKNRNPIILQSGDTHTEKFEDNNSANQWFVAVASCGNPKKSIEFSYNITFKNADTNKSAELKDIVAPTIFYAMFLLFSALGFTFITWRTSQTIGALKPFVHRLALKALVAFAVANICAWIWTANHEYAPLVVMLLFQGLSHVFLMRAAGFLAVANQTLTVVGKFSSWFYFGLGKAYVIAYFVMGLVGESIDFPGVTGSQVFANGWSIVASIFRFLAAIAWVIVMFTSWRANQHQRGTDRMHVFQWFMFGFSVALWLLLLPISIWANYTDIYTCSPGSLVAGYAASAMFDGCILLLLVIVIDPTVSTSIFGDILGSCGYLEALMFWKWNDLNWSTSAVSYNSAPPMSGGEFGDSVGASHKPGSASGSGGYQQL